MAVRITAELRRRGWQVNHKRVARILREDNLLCLRRKKFVVTTTDSKHGLAVYPNLAADLEPTGIDQLWVADITYVRLETEPRLSSGEVEVLDVRRGPRGRPRHIENATWWPLDNFKIAPPEMDHNASIAVHCKSGYRSMIACSLLQRAGFRNVTNVTGGFIRRQEAKLPTAIAKPVDAR